MTSDLGLMFEAGRLEIGKLGGERRGLPLAQVLSIFAALDLGGLVTSDSGLMFDAGRLEIG